MDGSSRSWAHSSFQEQRCTIPALPGDGWTIPRTEFGESVLAHFSEMRKGPKLLDRWKSAVWLGKSELTDEHLVRTDERVVYARSVRRLAEHSWSEVNLRAVVETPQKPKSTTVDIPPAAEPLSPPPEAPEIPEDEKEEPAEED